MDLAIETVNLVKDYARREGVGLWATTRRVVDRINLHVEKGRVYGFLGKNGAGKTTTIKMLLGLTFPTTGDIRILGQPPTPAIRSRMGFAPEKPVFYPHLTALEILRYVGRLSGLDRIEIDRRAARLLDLVSLKDDAHTLVKNFSKGMQQRLGLIQSLLADPEILIFDEPATGLDPFGRKLIKNLILGMRGEGKTVFFSSHQLLDVQEVCDRVGIIHYGELVAEDSVQALTADGLNLEERFVQMVSELDRKTGRASTID